uniref:2-oxoglutarate and iron dependent oxygenase domain containing 3 n=2 Tax=Catharus TaxID=9184 RepID=A0A8C3Y8V8_CATUS
HPPQSHPSPAPGSALTRPRLIPHPPQSHPSPAPVTPLTRSSHTPHPPQAHPSPTPGSPLTRRRFAPHLLQVLRARRGALQVQVHQAPPHALASIALACRRGVPAHPARLPLSLPRCPGTARPRPAVPVFRCPRVPVPSLRRSRLCAGSSHSLSVAERVPQAGRRAGQGEARRAHRSRRRRCDGSAAAGAAPRPRQRRAGPGPRGPPAQQVPARGPGPHLLPLSRGRPCPGPVALRLPGEPWWGGGRAAPGPGENRVCLSRVCCVCPDQGAGGTRVCLYRVCCAPNQGPGGTRVCLSRGCCVCPDQGSGRDPRVFVLCVLCSKPGPRGPGAPRYRSGRAFPALTSLTGPVLCSLRSARKGRVPQDPRGRWLKAAILLLLLFAAAGGGFVIWSRLPTQDGIPEGAIPEDGVTEVLAHHNDNLRDKFVEIPCSEDYDSHKRFAGCTPRKCGRGVTDAVITREEAERIRRIAERGLSLGGSDGGASILDLHSGALSLGKHFVNLYRYFGDKIQDIFTEEDFALYRDVRQRIQQRIAQVFGISSSAMYLTKPTFFSRMNSTGAKTTHDEYWHPHVDKVTYGSFDYTSLLYLSDYSKDFGGGRFVFMDADSNKTVEPRAGRVAFFTSGSENLHRVEKVQWGTRFAVTISFSCDPEHGIRDPFLG